ncbi:MAG: hypothetical protein K9K64_08895 [Desulfohalobiaceae bacterium]|nr:hypothetical protein [Desulfohalobiaceae bacterium]
MKKDLKALTIRIEPEEHEKIKKLSDDTGKSIKDLTLEAFELLSNRYRQIEAGEELSSRDASIEAAQMWDEVLIEQDIPNLLESRNRDEVTRVLGEYFDRLDFDVWPYNEIDPGDLADYLAEVREYFINEGLSYWELEILDAETRIQ